MLDVRTMQLIRWLLSQAWATTPHSGSTLASHLLGTYSLLRVANASANVCLAGLLHSVYGTSKFMMKSGADRESIVALVGPETESLIFAFSTANRPACFDAVLHGHRLGIDEDLLIIEIANLLEQRSGSKFLCLVGDAAMAGKVLIPDFFSSIFQARGLLNG